MNQSAQIRQLTHWTKVMKNALSIVSLSILIPAIALGLTSHMSPRYQSQVQRHELKHLGSAPLTAQSCNTPTNPIVNCGFEDGDLTGWEVTDVATPFFPLSADTAGVDLGMGFFISSPTEGSFAALHGFDGDGPDVIQLAQDVTIPNTAQVLRFDYRAGWDLATFGAVEDRVFEVQIEPTGGGTPLQSTIILTAQAGTTQPDTGSRHGAIDIRSFAGQAVRISFKWTIPENLSGPGFFQLDNVTTAEAAAIDAPALDPVGLTILAVLLLGAATFVLKRNGNTGVKSV